MPTLESAKFEKKIMEILTVEFKTAFHHERGKKIVDIQGVRKSFDFVSKNEKQYIGDAKYYKMCPNGKPPHAKLSTISEYVWLLEKTLADHKFLVFGLDIRVPNYWLDNKYGKLTKVAFYFYDETGLKRLN
ncbi:MAG: hypothetical protein WCK16_01920 [Candidatus Moraniibacteriota bacterium]